MMLSLNGWGTTSSLGNRQYVDHLKVILAFPPEAPSREDLFRIGGSTVENAKSSGEYEAIYQKLWLAHALYEASWDGKKYRLNPEEPVYAILNAADQQHPAWWQYSMLMGRSQEFFDFIQEKLGISSENTAAKVQEFWGRVATARMRNYVKTSVNNKKIVQWPYSVD